MRIFLMAAAGVLIAGAASAATFYDCKINVSKNHGSLPDRFGIQYDPDAGKALVYDPFIKHYFGDPIEAEISTNNDKRLTVAWDFENIKGKTGRNIPRVRFRATVLKATNEATITSTYYFGEGESGFGTCKAKSG